MIKCKEGRIKIEGNRSTIRTDLICIFRALIEEGIIKEEADILRDYKIARMSEKEIDNNIRKILEDLKAELEELTK